MFRVMDRFDNMLMHCEWALAQRLLNLGLARIHPLYSDAIVLDRREGQAGAKMTVVVDPAPSGKNNARRKLPVSAPVL